MVLPCGAQVIAQCLNGISIKHLAPLSMAAQVGEAMQVHSGGVLRATPHYVRAPSGPAAAGVARNTFAVFMQPDVTEPMNAPEGEGPACGLGAASGQVDRHAQARSVISSCSRWPLATVLACEPAAPGLYSRPPHVPAPAGANEAQVEVGQWQRGQTFGDFAKATFKKYYGVM
jgi:hypothetical protein